MLSGCSSLPSSINPVEWWHGLQGGAIAEQRPPPPGADQPYPNLATVPARPPAPDQRLHQQVADALVADRANAQHAAAAAPLADPSLPSASPALFGRGTVPPPPTAAPAGGAEPASASLEAASAPPPPAAAGPSPTPASSPGTAPLGPPPGADTPGSTSPRDAAALPPLPGAPPARPGLAGPPAAPPAAPRVPSVPPQGAAAAPAAKQVGQPVPIAFAPGSDTLAADQLAALRRLAARRRSATVVVTGFGEAASADPGAQSGALALGLARARSMAAALASAGVPPNSVRVDAEASGRGGVARLVE